MTIQTDTTLSLDILENRLRMSRPLHPAEAAKVRGYFGTVFSDQTLLHHHRADGRLVYDYPRVQFKVLEQSAHLIGLAEGCDLVVRLWSEADRACIDGCELPILESGLVRRRDVLGPVNETVRYCFLTPWLGLNQENHDRYSRARSDTDRQRLLERVVVGNCLSLAKSFGVRVERHLTACAADLRPRHVRLKDVPLLGFVGTFTVNFLVPDRLGIGKSVSRGFGTVERITENNRREQSC
jgi:hypothetical protein